MEESKILDASALIAKEVGLTTIFGIIEYPPASKYCDILFPEEEDFSLAIEISWGLRKIGKPVGAVDVLVASMCINRDMELITKDKDFEIIQSIEPEFRFKIMK